MILTNIALIISIFLIFVALAKLSERNQNNKLLIIIGIVLLLFEVVLLMGFVENLIELL